jgi:hypothetical protein
MRKGSKELSKEIAEILRFSHRMSRFLLMLKHYSMLMIEYTPMFQLIFLKKIQVIFGFYYSVTN